MSDVRFRVQINFRSRNSMVLVAENFKVSYRNEKPTKIEWTNANPEPLWVNLNDIESIWNLGQVTA